MARLGKSWGYSMPSLSTLFFPNLHMLTNPEALSIPFFWVLMEASSDRYD